MNYLDCLRSLSTDLSTDRYEDTAETALGVCGSIAVTLVVL
jgi:hypothetical protein